MVGKDVAAALGYKDTVNALKSHVDYEDKRGWQITTPGGNAGNYQLIVTIFEERKHAQSRHKNRQKPPFQIKFRTMAAALL